MAHPRVGKIALFTAPVVAIAATLLLMAATAQAPQILGWGGLITLVTAAPLAVPLRYRCIAIWVCAALVLAMIALSILSIGVYFTPALAALAIAGVAHRTKSRTY